MEIETVRQLIHQASRQIRDTTSTIIRSVEQTDPWDHIIQMSENIRANEDAQIYRHLETAFDDILNPNILLRLREPQGYRKSINLGGYLLTVNVVHRAIGIEDIHGVDVFYNFNDWKALAFQHKKRDRNNTLSFSKKDEIQRNKIRQLCKSCTLQKAKGKKQGFLEPLCASVYAIGDVTSNTRHVISACKMGDYRKHYGSDPRGIHNKYPVPSDLSTVDNMFIQCTIGRIQDNPESRIQMDILRDICIAQPDLIFDVNLSSRFR